jgi:hypothetical protein
MDIAPNSFEYTIRNCVFGFKCSMDWNSMRVLDRFSDEGSEIRFCTSCQREVYESNTDDELLENIRLNRCVSIFRDDPDDLCGLSRLTGVVMPKEFKTKE